MRLFEDLDAYVTGLARSFPPGSTAVHDSRQLKRIWNAAADHTFMQTVQTVHWVRKSDIDNEVSGIEKMNIRRRDEIATVGYKAGAPLTRSEWGTAGWGLLVKGRITFAAGDMNMVYSGYHVGALSNPNVDRWRRTSGIPRRPTTGVLGTLGGSDGVIVDEQTFNLNASSRSGLDFSKTNEFIVDNWRPVAIIVSVGRMIHARSDEFALRAAQRLHGFSQRAGIPIVDEKKRSIDIVKATEKKLTADIEASRSGRWPGPTDDDKFPDLHSDG